MALPPGLYEQAITQGLEAELTQIATDQLRITDLDPDEVPHLLAPALTDRITHALASFGGDARLTDQPRLANQVLALLEQEAKEGGATAEDRFADSATKLLAVLAPKAPGLGNLIEPTRRPCALGERAHRQRP